MTTAKPFSFAPTVLVSLRRILPAAYQIEVEADGPGEITFHVRHDGDSELPPHVLSVTTPDMRAFHPCLSVRRQRWDEAAWANAWWEHHDAEAVRVAPRATPDDIAAVIAASLYTLLLGARSAPQPAPRIAEAVLA